MAKISITLPERYLFTTTLQIYESHINYGGHLDNARLVGLMSEARERFFRDLGFSQTDVDGCGIVVADTAVQYLAEAFYGETLVFNVGIQDTNPYGCDLVYNITRQADQKNIAKAKNGIVFFNYDSRKIHLAPAAFTTAIAQRGERFSET